MLDELPVQGVLSWNEIISGYIHNRQDHEALKCFQRMQSTSFTANRATFICILRACGSIRSVDKGKIIHSELLSRGLLEEDVVLGTALVDMYCKCGTLPKAQDALRRLPVRNAATWNALITGYAHSQKGQEAMNCYEEMKEEGFSPDPITFACSLKACGRISFIESGEKIHHEIICMGLENSILGTPLVDMYAKCNMLQEARDVFDSSSFRTAISWNALITGYVQNDQAQEAIICFDRMRSEGFSPDVVTFTCILKACASLGFWHKGKGIHDEITSRKLLEKDIVLGNAAVDMYAKCGMLDKAQELLEELPVRDIVSWNAIISGYADQGQGCKALNCFDQMQAEGLSPGVVTFIATLKACGSVGAVDKGIKLHYEILQKRLLEKNVVLGNALVDMYAKCGALGKAQKVLEGIHIRNVVSWNALIAGHVLQGNNHKALDCFRWMQSEGLFPDTVTFICILKACGSTGAIDLGKHVHNDLVRRGLLGRDIVLGNALVDMYAKCGLLAKAQELLEELPIHDVVSWNVLIAGYANQGQCYEVLQCFEQMQSEGLSPDAVTFICILKVCGTVGAIDQGKQIHETISTKGLLKKDMVLGNALVDMYAKCGLLAKAQEVLENELPQQNVVSWSSLITGYAQQGQGHEAMNHFKKMQIKGLSPDEITFLCVLSACSNSGLSDEAESLFAHMTKTYGLTPCIRHHIWMILVLGYGGYFDKAVSVIKVMPHTDCPALWLALLGACRKWGNVMFGALAFDHITQLDSACATAYVLMGNIFASAGMQEDAEKVKSMIPKHHMLPQNVYLTP